MKRITFNCLIPIFFIAACSGGSGGISGNGNNNNPPPAGLTIDSANGLEVSQVAYQSVVSSGDMAGLAGSGVTADSGGGLAKPTMPSQPGGLLAGILQKVPVGPTEIDCAAGGKVTVTMEIVDILTFAQGVLSAGDTILNEYAMCDEGFGEVIDGDIDSEVDAFAGNILANVYDLTMTLTLIDFQVAAGGDVVTANGDGTAVLNTLNAPYVEASVSGNLMTTDTNNSSETLSNYSSAQTLDAGVIPSPYTMVASGTLDSSQLAGAITYSTPVMFEGFDAGYPNAGELLIVGDGSSARIIAESNGVDVTIELYSNTTGSGTPDDTIMTTWAELAAF